MSTREHAVKLLDSLTEEQLLDFLRLFADDNTLALVESEMIANNPDKYKQYDSFDEIMKEIDEEDDEQN